MSPCRVCQVVSSMNPCQWSEGHDPAVCFLFKILSWLVCTPGEKDKPW